MKSPSKEYCEQIIIIKPYDGAKITALMEKNLPITIVNFYFPKRKENDKLNTITKT